MSADSDDQNVYSYHHTLINVSKNRLPRKLLGAWCYKCNRLSGGQLKSTRKTYLDLLNILKFDESDPILGSNRGELGCIFALITGDIVEFNIRADHDLHELVKDG